MGEDRNVAARDGYGVLLGFLLLSWLVNIISLAVADWIFDGVTIDGWWPLILGAAVLGVANTIIKPFLTLLALPFIIITLGLALIAVNASDPGARGMDRARLLDRRVLDVRRRDDRRRHRQLARPRGFRQIGEPAVA